MSKDTSIDHGDVFELIRSAEQQSNGFKGANNVKSETFDAKAERARRESIKNDNMESDQRMKRGSLIVLFAFLGLETVAVIVIIFLQGFKNDFYIEEWSFRVFMGATLTQIATMLHTAIKHLFPDLNLRRE